MTSNTGKVFPGPIAAATDAEKLVSPGIPTTADEVNVLGRQPLPSTMSDLSNFEALDFKSHYSKFLILRDSIERQKYDEFKLSASTAAPQSFMALGILFFTIVAVKSNFNNLFISANPMWTFYHVIVVIYAPFRLLMILQSAIARRRPRGEPGPVRWSLFRYIGDVSMIFVVLFYGILMVARSTTGPCDPNITLWTIQACNPNAAVSGLPIELSIIYILVPLAQIMQHGVSWATVCLCHAIILTILLWQCSYLNVIEWPFLIIYYMFTVLCSYEIEHQRLVAFLTKRFLHEQASAIILQAQTIDEMNQTARQQEITTLKAVLGCVAHDLQTPMQSILMDTEHMAALINNESRTTATAEAVAAGNDEIKTALKQVRLVSEFMSLNIRRALEFIKTESHVLLQPMISSFDFNDVILQAIQWISVMKHESYVIEYQPLPNEACKVIFSDRSWLLDNVLCFLSNAVKYSPRGSIITVSVKLILPSHDSETAAHENSSTDKVTMLQVSVEDNGIGVPAEERDKLFKPFSVLQKMTGGTGIGLFSLSKRVASLQGEFGVTSRNDGQQGSIFYFSIPYRPDESISTIARGKLRSSGEWLKRSFVYSGTSENGEELRLAGPANPLCQSNSTAKKRGSVTGNKSSPILDAIATAVATAHALTDPAPSANILSATADTQTQTKTEKRIGDGKNGNDGDRKAIRILLVDDSIVVLKSIERALQRVGYHVVTADNGQDGLHEFTVAEKVGKMFDLVLSDMQMPVMDGLEFCKRLRVHENNRIEQSGDGLSDIETGPPSLVKNVIFALMSANTTTDIRKFAEGYHIDAILEKPFSVAKFEKTVKNLLPK